ncbi:MAG: SDR family NAD(P)-dependent oxidoreductase [Chitinophagaceae bacterium]|nr:MAG: SDR family NAD(P)-dependent oxidoreductase [Chitinophagaceae bacterium]
MNQSYAVVTGSSQGLGYSFANTLAQKGHNLILISLPNQNLSKLSQNLHQQYKVKVVFYEVDLCIKENILNVCNCINEKYDIDILINNAGIGGSKMFEKASTQYLESIIYLNILATTLITHQLLPNLKKRNKAYILNISSLAGLSPIGYKTIYPASKAFIHSFSRGLYQELRNTNVFVSVVNPGAMATNDETKNRIKNQGFWGKLTLLEPDSVANKCIKQIYKRDTVIVVNPISWLFLRIMPIWVRLPLLTNTIKKEVC